MDFQPHWLPSLVPLFADFQLIVIRTAVPVYDRLLARYCRLSVSLSETTYCGTQGRSRRLESCIVMFLAGDFLFPSSDTSAV